MAGTSNIHTEQLWRLRDHFARDGAIDPDEARVLAAQEAICDRMNAVHGLLFRAGGIPRDLARLRPDLVAEADEAMAAPRPAA